MGKILKKHESNKLNYQIIKFHESGFNEKKTEGRHSLFIAVVPAAQLQLWLSWLLHLQLKYLKVYYPGCFILQKVDSEYMDVNETGCVKLIISHVTEKLYAEGRVWFETMGK